MASSERKDDNTHKSETKWGKILWTNGFTQVPNVIIQRQADLGLTPIDFAIIMVLASHWWEGNKPARPGKKRIADVLRVDPRTVQRRIAQMESLGLLERHFIKDRSGDNRPNEYVLTGLIKRAEAFALEKAETKKQRESEGAQAAKRRRPRATLPRSG
jgi:DNA-binding MarR family transcriptional regulator